MLFSDLAQTFKKLEETASRNKMTEILADLFRRAGTAEIGKICYLLLGRVAPLFEPIEFGVADKFMIRAIARAYGAGEDRVRRVFKKAGDIGLAAQECYHVPLHGSRVQRLSVSDIFVRLTTITAMGGVGSQEKKIEALASLLASVDSLSARYIARIPLDKLRLGFSDMTMLDALSWMLAGDKSLRVKLEGAYNVRPDIGYLAQTVKEKGIKGLAAVNAKVGAPILPALCQRLPTADEMIKKMCRRPDQNVGGRASSTEASGGTVAVEGKYDGTRVQIHYKRTPNAKCQMPNVKTFSRNLENTTLMFPELSGIGKQLNAAEVILDSEAIGVDPATGKLIPFQETMTRKRKHNIEETRRSVPLKFFVFDILLKDGKDVLNKPFSERRKMLEQTVKKGNILTISPQIVTDSPGVLRTYHNEQLAKGLEGVVVKKWESPYEPGRRGYSWVKFKEEEGKAGKLSDTIDAVVMGYTAGQGKRTAFGVGQMLLGVRDGEDFVTVTKLGTGATEKELADLFKKLKALRVPVAPKEYKNVNTLYTPDVWVTPSVVLEIAGDDLTRSPAHGAGVAVRFPRLVRIRTDKSPRQATTVAEVVRMYRLQ